MSLVYYNPAIPRGVFCAPLCNLINLSECHKYHGRDLLLVVCRPMPHNSPDIHKKKSFANCQMLCGGASVEGAGHKAMQHLSTIHAGSDSVDTLCIDFLPFVLKMLTVYIVNGSGQP